MDQLGNSTLQQCLRDTGEPLSVYQVRCLNQYYLYSFTTETWKQILHATMHPRLMAYLSTCHLDAFQFGPEMILTGSAMIQLSLNKHWENADIDIFCMHRASTRVLAMLDASGYHVNRIINTPEREHSSPNGADATDENPESN